MGLQTVTWPLLGEVRHRDSIGSDAVLSPGQLNLMTAGSGIAHSEYSLGDGAVELDALQLWIALPDAARWGERGFERHESLPTMPLPALHGPDAEAIVVLGSLGDIASPATTYSPLVGAQIRVAPGSRVQIPLASDWEHAIVVLEGELEVQASAAPGDEPTRPGRNDLLYLGTGRDHVDVASRAGALVFLLGGEPLEEELVMWWNFVGRSHEEIVQAREEWESGAVRFGAVAGHGDVRVPAPPMPHVRLTPRRRHD
jgi:hypothetical protein